MQALTFYRGIAVPSAEAEPIITTIRANGFTGEEGSWSFRMPDILEVRRNLEALFESPDLERTAFFSQTPDAGVCACGMESGAVYYAASHNLTPGQNDYPIVMEFTAPVDEVYVDSRDFLCAAFQLWDRNSSSNQVWQAAILSESFGPGISRYFSASCGSSAQSYRIAMCNLAAIDPNIMVGHYANKKVIAGRYNTKFASSFIVKAPVEANRIRRVYSPAPYRPETEYISLQKFFDGPNSQRP